MIGYIVLAASMYLCPGEIYTDMPREGCRLFETSGPEGFSRITETTGDSKELTSPRSDSTSSNSTISNPSTPSESCALYSEYVHLDLKTQGGFVNTSPEEVDRWQTLRRMFQATDPPHCP